jgi:hypothetical protein
MSLQRCHPYQFSPSPSIVHRPASSGKWGGGVLAPPTATSTARGTGATAARQRQGRGSSVKIRCIHHNPDRLTVQSLRETLAGRFL